MVDDAIGAYDAALRAYFVAARDAGEDDHSNDTRDLEGTGDEIVAATETAANTLRATVLGDPRTWAVCLDQAPSRTDGE